MSQLKFWKLSEEQEDDQKNEIQDEDEHGVQTESQKQAVVHGRPVDQQQDSIYTGVVEGKAVSVGKKPAWFSIKLINFSLNEWLIVYEFVCFFLIINTFIFNSNSV